MAREGLQVGPSALGEEAEGRRIPPDEIESLNAQNTPPASATALRLRKTGAPSAAPASCLQHDQWGIRWHATNSSDVSSSLGRSLDELWGKLDAVRGTPGRLLPAEPATISIRSPLAIDYAAHAKTIAVLERAVAQHLAISCRYLALSTGQLTSRIVEPGELYFDPGLETLYLIGWCRLRSEVRIFAAHRFRMVALTEEKAAPRGEATSSAALRGAFRVWRSGNVTRVAVEFSPEAAPEIRERRWHVSQEIEERPGGALRLTVQVSGTEEIERWVLGFGERARVIEPAALAERIGRRLAEAAERYQGEGRAEAGNGSRKTRSNRPVGT